MGGNLTLITSILGTEGSVDYKGRILFFEDVHVVPYEADRYITQLKNAGIFTQVVGVIVGQLSWASPVDPAQEFTLRELLETHVKPFGIPCYCGAQIGHIKEQFTIPFGIEVEMDADACSFSLLEQPLNK